MGVKKRTRASRAAAAVDNSESPVTPAPVAEKHLVRDFPVIHYGAFKESLDRVVDVMRSEYASSIIIRGNPGSGKKTLIREAMNITGVRCVSLSSQYYSEDYAAMKAIVSELGFKSKARHISDLMDEIRKSANNDEKLVIVLVDFEEFCRKRQSLLYNLMNLIHTNPNQDDRGLNLTLVGLTASLDWAENIEKRVRSRLNAKCIDLNFPYRNQAEFVEFASKLLGGYKIKGEFKEHLEYIYNFSNRSIRTLKKFLFNVCSQNSDASLTIELGSWADDYQILSNVFLRERLRYLTRSQLDLMKVAVSYCSVYNSTSFTLSALEKHALDWRCKSLDLTSDYAMRDATMLVSLKLIKPNKADQVVSEDSEFFPAATGRQFKAVIDGDPTLQYSVTDHFWKNLKSR